MEHPEMLPKKIYEQSSWQLCEEICTLSAKHGRLRWNSFAKHILLKWSSGAFAKRFWALDDFDPWWSRGWWFSDQNLRCPHVIDCDTQITMTNWCPRVIGRWSNTSKFFKCPWSSNLVISSCSCCTWAHIPRFRTNIYCIYIYMCVCIYIYIIG